MISQRIKDLYFTLLQPLTKLNYLRYRLLYSFLSKKGKTVWLNLGSGDNYLNGFINIEGNIFRKSDICLDLRNGLPFPNNTIDGIYACHVFEHFYINELEKIILECYRVLKMQGGIRILVPSLEKAIASYVNKEYQWFSDFPRHYESLGGRFQNFIFCDGQHKLSFDFSFLKELLELYGFKKIVQLNAVESEIFPQEVLDKIEDREYHNKISLIVEGIKL